MRTFIALSFVVAVVLADILGDKKPFYPAAAVRELEPRITNGEIASPGQFPYQVGLMLASGKNYSWCGGTIISDRWILTAAHCTLDADSATVYLGAFDIGNISETGQQRIFTTKRNFYTHANFTLAKTSDDIALIKLPVKIEFNKLIQPAALPKKNGNYSTYKNEMVVASGWGLESTSAESISQFLRYIEVPVVSESVCNRYYFFRITPDMICVGTKGKKSTCSGDSGGPLVYVDEKGVKTVIGATSFGIGLGCEKGWPGVFTRIASYLDWIEKISGVVNK